MDILSGSFTANTIESDHNQSISNTDRTQVNAQPTVSNECIKNTKKSRRSSSAQENDCEGNSKISVTICHYIAQLTGVYIVESDIHSLLDEPKRRRLYDDKISHWAAGKAVLIDLQQNAFRQKQEQELRFACESHEKKLELELQILRTKLEDSQAQREANKIKADLEIEILKLQKEEIRFRIHEIK